MQLRLRQEELARLLPSEPQLASHCRRVAALTGEIGARMGLPSASLVVLEQAALLHHTPALLRSPGALDRLLRDVIPAPIPALASRARPMQSWPEELEATLAAFSGFRGGLLDAKVRFLPDILTLSNWLDEQIELGSLDPQPMAEIWENLEQLKGMVNAVVFDSAAKALAAPYRTPPDYRWEFPVQALVAKDILCVLASNRGCDLRELAGLAARDPVLAGKLIQTANSALYARRSPVSSIPQAISFIGLDASRNVLMAAAVQSFFASARLAGIWRHCLWMAQYLEKLAHLSGFLPPDEAFLLGLVHDVGRIAIALLPRSAGITFARLAERGCPPCYIEQLLLGRDHAEIGAEILRSWQFPDVLAEAVRYHHRPADCNSPLAAALYLAELWAESEEDLSSHRHFAAASARTSFSLETLARATHCEGPLFRVLSVA
ncbi:MAG: hypothetical protein C5B51_26870 [Terriglobia bacterium]|nr:MAG: hypothetical protein C5B51_26870 [Terriglobia bacterium]